MSLLLTTQMIIAQMPSYVPTSGLVGYWGFNGNANDASPNANNGTVVGATLTADRFGNANGSYLFNRNTVSYITLPIVNNLTSNFSVLIWVKPTTTVNMQPESTVCPGSVSVSMANSNQNWALQPGQIPNPDFGGGGLSIGTNGYMTTKHGINVLEAIQQKTGAFSGYNCIVQVYQNNTLFVYENGILVSTKPFGCPAKMKLLSTQTLGGALYSSNFSGEVDEVGIWNRALTQNEINNLFNAKNITICQSIGQDSTELYTNGYVTGPENKIPDQAIHTDTKWISVTGAESLNITTMQHRLYDKSRIFDQNDNLIWEWAGESVNSTTWYQKDHIVNVAGNEKVRIEFYQGYTAFCNGYLKVTQMTCSNLSNNSNAIKKQIPVKIYPNPTNGQITIDSSDLSNINGWAIKISNILGQEIFSSEMKSNLYVVPLNTLGSKGVYFVKIYDDANNLLNTKKIIVQ